MASSGILPPIRSRLPMRGAAGSPMGPLERSPAAHLYRGVNSAIVFSPLGIRGATQSPPVAVFLARHKRLCRISYRACDGVR